MKDPNDYIGSVFVWEEQKVKEIMQDIMNFTKQSDNNIKKGNPADKIEPKFKVGDKIVFNGLTLYVKEVVKGFYITVSKGGITNSYDWNIDHIARLWTAQDAKEDEK